jgi:quercetin dioxygenase-like cupin family protein
MEKSKVLIIVEMIDYSPNSIVEKTIIKKTMGHISAFSFDSGENLRDRVSPYDTFVQIIEGTAELIIDGEVKVLLTGQALIIPAHLSSRIKANERFKMISTVIKSGYDEVSLAE